LKIEQFIATDILYPIIINSTSFLGDLSNSNISVLIHKNYLREHENSEVTNFRRILKYDRNYIHKNMALILLRIFAFKLIDSSKLYEVAQIKFEDTDAIKKLIEIIMTNMANLSQDDYDISECKLILCYIIYIAVSISRICNKDRLFKYIGESYLNPKTDASLINLIKELIKYNLLNIINSIWRKTDYILEWNIWGEYGEFKITDE
jgi:hypothetical protein